MTYECEITFLVDAETAEEAESILYEGLAGVDLSWEQLEESITPQSA